MHRHLQATYSNAVEPPFIRVSALENLIGLKERLVEAGKFLLVRAYPGPLGGWGGQDFRVQIV